MITDVYDNMSDALINPDIKETNPRYDACIFTFSHIIEKFVVENYDCRKVTEFPAANGNTDVYEIDYKGKSSMYSSQAETCSTLPNGT